ncbi:hypothetical protein C1H46_005807 [Malus baccata]|uniref:Uncharacterized protein n=1 Tax=Malus baccata TaxID=106549 RepID=A0A540NBT7_MALBA|nr:hypothetical protein C1H46_005807 [Malus baccata]
MGAVVMPSLINEGWFPLIVESNSHNAIHLVSLDELCLGMKAAMWKWFDFSLVTVT